MFKELQKQHTVNLMFQFSRTDKEHDYIIVHHYAIVLPFEPFTMSFYDIMCIYHWVCFAIVLAARGLFYGLFWMNEPHVFSRYSRWLALTVTDDDASVVLNEELKWNLMLGILSSYLKDFESLYVYMRETEGKRWPSLV